MNTAHISVFISLMNYGKIPFIAPYDNMINASSPLTFDRIMTSQPSSDDDAPTELVNGLAELIQLAVNFTSFWAPAAILNADPQFSKNWPSINGTVNSVVQLVECASSAICGNWTNYTENANNKNIAGNSGVHTNDILNHISTNVTLSTLSSYSFSNDTLTTSTFSTFTTVASVLTPNETKIRTLIVEPDLRVHHPFLAVILGIICAFVVFGNTLTMVSVWKERYLHTVTNYFVASLAAADCLVGAIVMPFSMVEEVMNKMWIFGNDWCDLWHSFDVLASTSSILHLCVISLDRWMAITDPITYPARMTPNKAAMFIAGIWLCSSLISFPAIAWWRAVEKEQRLPYQCPFTDDVGYLVFSSIISFYGPLTVMVFTYYRIYVVASKQMKSLKLGAKQIQSSCDNGDNAITLRIHRGGGGGGNVAAHTPCNKFKYSGESSDDQQHPTDFFCTDENGIDKGASIRSARNMKANWSVGKRLAKLAKERKAAKTLGIVMGVFILCWMPFFVTNILMGICAESCVFEPDLVYSIVTWLGWLNSAMNPAIYACWSRDFRRAFRKILCSCCTKHRRNKGVQRFSYCAKTPKVPHARKGKDEIGMISLAVTSNNSRNACTNATDKGVLPS